jgi:protein phosphatase
MPIVSAAKSDTGRQRDHNEDYIWINKEAAIYIVADGLGGHEAGEKASELTATTAGRLIVDGMRKQATQMEPAQIETLMVEALEASNKTVLAAANEDGQKRQMGATIVVAIVRLPKVYLCHAGDARVYLARDSKLMRLTEDDSFVAQLVAKGVISEDEARSHPYGSVVTKAIGQEPPLEPTFSTVDLNAGDWLLMCSDGLTDMVPETQIATELLLARGNPSRLVENLTNKANDAGGRDNISIVAIRVLPK